MAACREDGKRAKTIATNNFDATFCHRVRAETLLLLAFHCISMPQVKFAMGFISARGGGYVTEW